MCWLVFQITSYCRMNECPFFSGREHGCTRRHPAGCAGGDGTGSARLGPTRSSFEEGMEISRPRCRLMVWANLRLLTTELIEEKPYC